MAAYGVNRLTPEHTEAVSQLKHLKEIIFFFDGDKAGKEAAEKYNLLFGHLDLVRENKTNKLYVVDAGTFPEFSNWKHEIDPVSRVGDLILRKYQEIRN